MDHFLVLLPCKQGADPAAEQKRILDSLALRHAASKKFPLPAFKVGTLDSLIEASDELGKLDNMTENSLHKILGTGETLAMEDKDRSALKKVRAELQQVTVVERVANSPSPQEKTKDVRSYLESWHWDNFRHTGVSDISIKKLIEDLHKPVVLAEDVVKKRVAEYTEIKALAVAAERKVGGNLTVKDITEDVEAWNLKRSTPLPEDLLRRKASQCESTQLVMLFVAVHQRDKELWNSYASWGISEEQIREMDQVKEGDTDHTSDGVSISRILFKSGGKVLDLEKATASNPGGSQQGYGNHHDTGLAENVLDGSAETAWFDANSKPLVIDFGEATGVDQFAFATGTEAPQRDPVQWKVEGYTPPAASARASTVTINIENVGDFTVTNGDSEHTTMMALHKQLKTPVGKRIVLKEDGMPVQAVYDQLEHGASYTYTVEDLSGREYSKKEDHIDLGTWTEVQAMSNNFHTPTARRELTEFVKLQKPGKYHKYRFVPTLMRGQPQRGPIPCGNGAVPGTSEEVQSQGEHSLMSVMVFSQLEPHFKSLCRDNKMVVREYEPVTENGAKTKTRQAEHNELEARRLEKRDALLHSVKVQFSEAYSSWVHLKAVRGFVEAILRYGLPAKYVSVLFCCESKTSKPEDEIRSKLDKMYSDLAPKGFNLGEDANESNALQEKYPYVSLKIPDLDE
eukprot:TRINITY_DN14868_c0_g1_i1.p1 TRINITY_DN14868_c0_g1~~TRINITY_DN14868_c0_g1_i1.p1  ORF type:complete len:709 (+),score=338.11 TRINITY_DN14868_c0_g1_i1:77-2128(+)